MSEYSQVGYQKNQHNKLGESPPPHFKGVSGPRLGENEISKKGQSPLW